MLPFVGQSIGPRDYKGKTQETLDSSDIPDVKIFEGIPVI